MRYWEPVSGPCRLSWVGSWDDREEDLQDAAVADLRRVVGDLHGLGVAGIARCRPAGNAPSACRPPRSRRRRWRRPPRAGRRPGPPRSSRRRSPRPPSGPDGRRRPGPGPESRCPPGRSRAPRRGRKEPRGAPGPRQAGAVFLRASSRQGHPRRIMFVSRSQASLIQQDGEKWHHKSGITGRSGSLRSPPPAGPGIGS